MDLLNINFKSMLPYVIDAYTYVYGEEYREIISKRLNKAVIICYNDVNELKSYLSILKKAKCNELAVKFLTLIGENTYNFEKEPYSENLNDEMYKLQSNYLGDPIIAFERSNQIKFNEIVLLNAFREGININDTVIDNRIKLINYLRENPNDIITSDNYNDFIKSEEYFKLLKKIKKYMEIYQELLLEYDNWKKQISKYEEYVDTEQKRLDSILQTKQKDLFLEIYSDINNYVKELLQNKSLEEQMQIIFLSKNVSKMYCIEFFSEDNMKKLSSSDINISDKRYIVFMHKLYFQFLGLSIADSIFEISSEKDVLNYLNFLNNNDIKKYISIDLANKLSVLRHQKYEEALFEYYSNREDFKKNIGKYFENANDFTKKFMYTFFKDRKICVYGAGGKDENNEFVSIMFYTISGGFFGNLAFSFLHECGHVIEQNENGMGFEYVQEFDFGVNRIKNPYDSRNRKYERFNETINDIFAMKANEYLHNNGIYLFEDKKITSNSSKINTSNINKQLLYPLVDKFWSQIVKTKICANRRELIDYIGIDNFEQLVDILNRVDYLTKKGLEFKLEYLPDSPLVLEYYKLLEQAKQVYVNIDEYYSSIKSQRK